MIHAGTGYSEDNSLERAALEAAARALDRAGMAEADFLFLFATLREPAKGTSILKKLKSFTGAQAVVGSSAFGVLTEEAEIEQRPSAAVLAVQGERQAFFPFLIPHLQENNFKAGQTLAGLLRQAGWDASAAVIFPDSFSFQHGSFLDGFETGSEFIPITGGCASERGGQDKTFQWVGDRFAFDSVSGMAFGKELEFQIGITQSCQPLSEPLPITRSQGNVIFEIDGRPAYDIFLEHITRLRFEDTHEVFHRLFLGLPLTSFQTELNRPQYLVRNIMGVNARKGVVACAAQVEPGDYVTFALRDARKAREDMVLMLEDLVEKTAGRQPAFGFYFSCCARGSALYGTTGEDTRLIREHFPRLPLAGFFTYGEMAPVEYVNHLHHYSGVLALAFEKDS